jgi:DNA-binding transcriptional LysR family regulator
MERRQLECLVAVAEAGSFRRAGERLFVTQSAVSQALQTLEEELGERLLDRPAGGRGGGIHPTAAGELLLPVARDILRRFEDGKQVLAQLRGLLIGRLSIGAVDVAATYHLPEPLRRFKRRHPGLELSVQVAGSVALTEALRNAELDLAFVLGESIPAGLEGRHYRDDPMQVLASADLIAELGSEPDPERIAERGWITYPRGSVTRAILERAFREAGLPFPVSMAIDRPEVILQLVRAGLGLAVLPERLLEVWTVGEEVGRLTLPGLHPVRSIQILHRPGEGLSPAGRAFLAELDS